MVWKALVVGINQYPFLTDDYGNSKNLTTPARDAEEIAQLLENYSDFKVERLPKHLVNGKYQIDPDGTVATADLEQAISELFDPASHEQPEAALLYFAGHGLRKLLSSTVAQAYLAASDTDPNGQPPMYGYYLDDLRKVLENSTVPRQLIWLDCCHSGELFQSSSGFSSMPGKSRCLITASLGYERAYENTKGDHGYLSEALIQSLNPNLNPGGRVTTSQLIADVRRLLQAAPQTPITSDFEQDFVLTRVQQEPQKPPADRTTTQICPYKGLEPFENNEEDAGYFFGRDALIDTLVDRVEHSTFVAVVGASGSGKSSLVKAGLLYRLQQCSIETTPDLKCIAGSNQWKTLVFRPDSDPFNQLWGAIAKDAVWLEIWQRLQIKRQMAEQIQGESEQKNTAKQLADLIREAESDRVVMVVDQFEEIFSLTGIELRRQFLACLLGAIDYCQGKLCVILTMRADFFDKCLEENYSGLSARLQSNQVLVTPMQEAELRQAIEQPAVKVGLDLQPELVEHIMSDMQGAPGSLPLLQYTLKQAWIEGRGQRLTLGIYNQLGGIRGALNRQATRIYNDQKLFTEEERHIIKQIFLELTQPGEGTPDTRKPVKQEDLFKMPFPHQQIQDVITKLSSQNVRLLVTNRLISRSDTSSGDEIVDVAHEALIQYWDCLKGWINDSREALKQKRKIEEKATDWQDQREAKITPLKESQPLKIDFLTKWLPQHPLSHSDSWEFPGATNIRKGVQSIREWLRDRQAEDALLRGFQLAEAEEYLKKYGNQLPLSSDADRFVRKSLQRRNNRQRRRKLVESTIVLIAALSTGTLLINYQNAQIRQDAKNAETLIGLNKELDALVAALRVAQEAQYGFLVDHNTQIQAMTTLQSIVYGLHEKNRFIGHRDSVESAVMSPDGQHIVSADEDGILKLWKADGTLLKTIQAHSRIIYSLDFSQPSTDGKALLASSSADGSIKLWQLQGDELTLYKVLLGHSETVRRAIFSPDRKFLISAGADDTIKIWVVEGSGNVPLRSISAGQRQVYDLAFNPLTGQVASTGSDGSVQLWQFNPDGNGSLQQLRKFYARACNRKTCEVYSVSFSPDGNWLATGSRNGTVNLWDTNGKWIRQVGYHDERIRGLKFVPPSVATAEHNLLTLASASEDRTAKLWAIPKDITVNAGKPIEHVQLGGFTRGLRGVNFSADGNSLVSASADGAVRLWASQPNTYKPTVKDPETLWMSRDLNNPGSQDTASSSIAFSPDGQTLVAGGDKNMIRIWQLDPSRKVWSQQNIITPDLGKTYSVNFSPALEFPKFVTASGDQDDQSGTVILWDLQGNKTILKTATGAEKFPNPVLAVHFSSDGQTIAAGGGEGAKITLWNRDGQFRTTLAAPQGARIYSLSFSPDGQWLVAGDWKGNLTLWRRSGKTWKFDRQFPAHTEPVLATTFSHDSNLIASTSGDGTVKLWNLNGKLQRPLSGHTAAVLDVTFSPDDQTIASAGSDRSIILWDRAGNPLHKMTGPLGEIRSVQFNPALGSDFLASAADDGRIFLWDMNLDRLIKQGCELAKNYLQANPSLEDGDRRLCNLPASSPVLLVEQGRDLARQGKIEAAVDKLRAAKQPDPQTEAKQWAELTLQWQQLWHMLEELRPSSQLKVGLDRLKENAATLTQKLQSFLDRDPEMQAAGIQANTEANRLLALELLRSARSLLWQENLSAEQVQQVIAAYQQAKSLAPQLEIAADDWSRLCKQGASLGYAPEIMAACDQAVTLAPDQGRAREARALARLAQRNWAGAIEDLTAFIAWAGAEAAKSSIQFSQNGLEAAVRDTPDSEVANKAYQANIEQLNAQIAQRQQCVNQLQGILQTPEPQATDPQVLSDFCKDSPDK